MYTAATSWVNDLFLSKIDVAVVMCSSLVGVRNGSGATVPVNCHMEPA